MKRLLPLITFLLTSVSSFATPLVSIDPISQSVPLGSQVSVDINIAGLGSDTALGTYDINVGFDPALLSYVSAVFGDQLDLFGLGDIQVLTPSTGSVEVFELSLETVDDLINLQASAFRLATLTFDTLTAGSNSPITLSIIALGDAAGDSLSADLQEGSVTIAASAGPGTVPEPDTSALLLLGLGLRFMLVHRKTRIA